MRDACHGEALDQPVGPRWRARNPHNAARANVLSGPANATRARLRRGVAEVGQLQVTPAAPYRITSPTLRRQSRAAATCASSWGSTPTASCRKARANPRNTYVTVAQPG